MTIYAQISEGVVVGVQSVVGVIDDAQYIQIDEYDTELIGQHYDNGQFSPPPLSLPDAKQQRIDDIYATAKRAIEQLSADYPEDERRYWPQLEAESAQVAAGGDETDAPLIAAEAAAQGQDFSAYAAYIGDKAEQFRQHLNTLKAWRTQHTQAIQALDSVEAVQAYQVAPVEG